MIYLMNHLIFVSDFDKNHKRNINFTIFIKKMLNNFDKHKEFINSPNSYYYIETSLSYE